MYWKYANYVFRHKWFVMIECFGVGLFWRGLMHDMSKFRPSEFIHYAEYFYGGHHIGEAVLERFSYLGRISQEQVDRNFNVSWFIHIHRNPHHWQYWILREYGGETKVLPMPNKYILEMICDWVGAGKALGKHSPRNDKMQETRRWYGENKKKMILHNDTRAKIEILIGYDK